MRNVCAVVFLTAFLLALRKREALAMTAQVSTGAMPIAPSPINRSPGDFSAVPLLEHYLFFDFVFPGLPCLFSKFFLPSFPFFVGVYIIFIGLFNWLFSFGCFWIVSFN
jgi:hypothetical protein